MNAIAITILIFCVGATLIVSRRNVPLFLIIACCYITVGQKLIIAGANFPFFRFVILLGVVRVFRRGEKPATPINQVDKLVLLWIAWLFFASFFHDASPGSGPKYAVGSIIDLGGTYYLFRTLLQTQEEVRSFIAGLVLLLIPIGFFMVMEQVANYNVFSFFGYIPETPIIRGDRTRAQGPFSHPILAGSIGAACFPLAVAILKTHRVRALIGIAGCTMIVIASASSGPIMSLFFGTNALLFWRYRAHFKKLKWYAITIYVTLAILMERPAYYVISKIDLTGSSTGWHRSFLIERTIMHLNEWWLFGTDRTVHWMPSQGRISDKHTDVTNYYIAFGVNGGMICMLAVIAMVLYSARNMAAYCNMKDQTKENQWLIWCIGSALFANSATAVSVSFFGQAQVFFWLPIALLASMCAHYYPLTQNEESELNQEF